MQIDKNSKVVILKGGISEESTVSEATAESCSNALRQRELRVQEIAVGVGSLTNLASEIQSSQPDVIFNALHGGIGENGVIQGLLETLYVPYTHSGVAASSIAMDKSISKNIFRSQNLPVVEGILFKIGNLNQGQIMLPQLYNIQQKFNPIENVSSIDNNVQSNYALFGEGDDSRK